MKLTIVIALLSAGILFNILLPVSNAAVFAEVASASYCPDCPAMNEMLFDLYTSHEYNFYYVTMAGDKNEFAYDRIKNDYNFYWYPTIFLDGGYRVFLDASRDALEKAIEESMARERPNIDMEVEATWIQCPCQHGLDIEVDIRNNGRGNYNGMLRVYIAEINSRWDDYSGNQYHFAFLEFAHIDNISMAPAEYKKVYITWDPEDHFPDIILGSFDNLAVFAVLFNTTAHTQYANPPDKNAFNAYYVDAIDMDMSDNIPPSVSIVSPRDGYLYLLDREIMKIGKTVIIGRKTVKVNAWDEDGIEKVEIYVDGIPKKTLTNEDTWIWKDMGNHALLVKAYDKRDNNAIDIVNAFIMAA
jgi:glutaredoxin